MGQSITGLPSVGLYPPGDWNLQFQITFFSFFVRRLQSPCEGLHIQIPLVALMHFLLCLITFLFVSIAATLSQDWSEPNPAILFGLLEPESINSIPPREPESPTIFDLHSQGSLGKDLTSFNLIGTGSIPSAPVFSAANDLTSSNLISTGSTTILSDEGSSETSLLALTGTEETSYANSGEESLIPAGLSTDTPNQVCTLHKIGTSAKWVRDLRVRQRCWDLHNILNEESKTELRQLQRHTGSQSNREFDIILRDDSNWLHDRRKEKPFTYLQDNAGARYQCQGKSGRLIPTCCLGPSDPKPTPATEVQRRQLLPRQNGVNDKQNCVVYLLGRKWCEPATRRFCCVNMGEPMNPGWGFWGVDCVPMNTPLWWLFSWTV